jgi:MGT family glycosyltransferase
MPPQEAVTLRYRRALDTWLTEDLVGAATEALIGLAEDIGKPDLIATDPFLSASALAAEALSVPMVVCGWPAQADLNADNLFPVQQTLGTDSQNRVRRLLERFDLTGENFSRGPTPSIISPHQHISYFTRDWYRAEAQTLLGQNVFVGGMPEAPREPPPDWLARIPDEVPLGIVTLGSVFTGDLGFFSWGAQAVARAGLLPIVAIGWNPVEPEKKAELKRALPSGTRLLNWVPFGHVLPRARIIVHHGGMGTTHGAVVHGLPQIVVPHAADQRIQAQRVAQAKVGLNLSAHDVRQGMLGEGVHAIVHDEKVRETARQLAHRMAELGGPRRAAESVVSIVNFA